MTHAITIAKLCLATALSTALLNTLLNECPSRGCNVSNLLAHKGLAPCILRTKWILAEDATPISISWTETHAGIPASATRLSLSALHDEMRQTLRSTVESLMATFAHVRSDEVKRPAPRERTTSTRRDLGSPEPLTATVCISYKADFTPDRVATLAEAGYYNELIWLGETQKDRRLLHLLQQSQLCCSQEVLIADFQVAVRWSDGTASRYAFRLLRDPKCRVWVPLLISWT